jgi:hypothetical protein
MANTTALTASAIRTFGRCQRARRSAWRRKAGRPPVPCSLCGGRRVGHVRARSGAVLFIGHQIGVEPRIGEIRTVPLAEALGRRPATFLEQVRIDPAVGRRVAVAKRAVRLAGAKAGCAGGNSEEPETATVLAKSVSMLSEPAGCGSTERAQRLQRVALRQAVLRTHPHARPACSAAVLRSAPRRRMAGSPLRGSAVHPRSSSAVLSQSLEPCFLAPAPARLGSGSGSVAGFRFGFRL